MSPRARSTAAKRWSWRSNGCIRWIRLCRCLIRKKLVTLLNTEGFQKIVGREILKRLNFIRALGNNAAHSTRAISKEQARYALENLFVFLDFVDYCYGKGDEEREFDSSLLEQKQAVPSSVPADAMDATIEQLKRKTRHCGSSSPQGAITKSRRMFRSRWISLNTKPERFILIRC